jgi:hypothetical protein
MGVINPDQPGPECNRGRPPPKVQGQVARSLAGEADLKVRITVLSADRAEVFNSVNGKATGTDGTEYKVRGSADLSVEGGIGDPRDFVDFTLREIRR